MKMTELSPGLYKVRKQTYGARNSKGNSNSVQLLRVTGVGESCLYFVDHDGFGQHPKNMEGLDRLEIISRYDAEPQVNHCKITVSFADAAGQEFEFVVRDAWALRAMFETMPWLKMPFGYSASRAKEVKTNGR